MCINHGRRHERNMGDGSPRDLYILSLPNENPCLRHCLQYYLTLEFYFLI